MLQARPPGLVSRHWQVDAILTAVIPDPQPDGRKLTGLQCQLQRLVQDNFLPGHFCLRQYQLLQLERRLHHGHVIQIDLAIDERVGAFGSLPGLHEKASVFPYSNMTRSWPT